MRIAYISVYRDGTGYGNAASAMIKSIAKADVEVVPIWITLSGMPHKNNPFIESFESNDLSGFDVVIQQCLPDMFVRIEGVKNIGYFFWETDSFVGSGWKTGCNLMDEIWVTTEEQKQACIDSGVREGIIKIIDQPKEMLESDKSFDFNKYGIEHTYKFYTISDYSNKKNVSALIHGFLTEFNVYDNVSLVLKTYLNLKTAQESSAHIKAFISEIKKQIGKPEDVYPKIALITEMVSDQMISEIENSCDCFVSCSRGEGEGLPMAQAALKGKPVIAPNMSGISKNFINKTLLINQLNKKKVFGMNSGRYYNFNENWNDPSTSELCEKMRIVLNGGPAVEKSIEENKDYILTNFSIEACAIKMKELLNESNKISV